VLPSASIDRGINAGTYGVTTQIVSTTCAVGLHSITQPVTWTFAQTAPSCDFTMTNSVYPASQYAGHFTMVWNDAQVTWTSVNFSAQLAPAEAAHPATS
jgi:hypothetical protein